MTVSNVLTSLAACLCAQITVDGSPEPCFCGVVPGTAADQSYTGDCEDGTCGMAWVRLITSYPATAVGQPDQTTGNCATGVGFEVEVGIMRCMPVGDEQGNPPTPAELLATTDQQVKDMLTIRKAISCCTALPSRDYRLGAYVPMGPLGGLVGGSWTLTAVI